MDMSNFRPELHVAQRSRRDKLRAHQDNPNPPHHHHFELYNTNNNLVQFPTTNDLNPNYEPVRNCTTRPGNISYDPSQFCSEMIMANQEPETDKRVLEAALLGNSTRVTSNWVPNWKSVGPHSQSSSNWAMPNLEYQELQSSSSGFLHELVTTSYRQKGSDVISHTQALSLSLSSVPSPKVHVTQYADRGGTSTCANVVSSIQENSGNWNLDDVSIVSTKVLGNDLIHRNNPGPLGPFTGYATILKSSKFLRPAQQLLDELCVIARPCDKMLLEDGRVSRDSSGGTSSSMLDSYRPENHQNKAKLLYMQDEVSKRYKQYHQQMQMVVSSFESVAGLSAATPYVSLALKTVANHFRFLKKAITDQLESVRNALGEDHYLPSPNAGTSTTKDDGVSMLKFFDQNFQKQKGSGISNLDGQQHVWRPQRGLPERAVSILRAWLFDHFLHPYPTDTDKHMLATQTGLTRNQVSNWFINARVRVWKPMVEEIHMLETKGGGGVTAQTGLLDVAKPTSEEGCFDRSDDHHGKSHQNVYSDKQVERAMDMSNHVWNHQDDDKRCRTDQYHIPTGVHSSLVGLGAVSLTLGLRQSAESGAQRAPLQQEHHRMRSHYGGQIIRDYVG